MIYTVCLCVNLPYICMNEFYPFKLSLIHRSFMVHMWDWFGSMTQTCPCRKYYHLRYFFQVSSSRRGFGRLVLSCLRIIHTMKDDYPACLTMGHWSWVRYFHTWRCAGQKFHTSSERFDKIGHLNLFHFFVLVILNKSYNLWWCKWWITSYVDCW